MDATRYLGETPMLDYSAKTIQSLIENRRWRELDEFERIRRIYNFVRDDILFGYNISDDGRCLPKCAEEHLSQLGGALV